MRFRIEKANAEVEVRIDDVTGQEQALVDAIQRCRQSAWACASGECMNIQAIEDREADGCVFLTFKAKPGIELSAGGIEQCLHYLLPEARKTP